MNFSSIYGIGGLVSDRRFSCAVVSGSPAAAPPRSSGKCVKNGGSETEGGFFETYKRYFISF